MAEAQPKPCEAPTPGDGRVDGAGNVKRVGYVCGWPSPLGNGTGHVPEVQRLVALRYGASGTHREWDEVVGRISYSV